MQQITLTGQGQGMPAHSRVTRPVQRSCFCRLAKKQPRPAQCRGQRAARSPHPSTAAALMQAGPAGLDLRHRQGLSPRTITARAAATQLQAPSTSSISRTSSTTHSNGSSPSSSNSSSQSSASGQQQAPAPVPYEARVRGCLLGAMCGNVLGAPHHGEGHYTLTRRYPLGVQDFDVFDPRPTNALQLGQHTGDFSLLLATAHSLAQHGMIDADRLASSIAQRCNPSARHYSLYSAMVVRAVGEPRLDVRAIPEMAVDYLHSATFRDAASASDRAEREPQGPSDVAGAARIAPVALAYRSADPATLYAAVLEACALSHTHPLGLDAARVAAAAIVWLTQHTHGEAGCQPGALLQHLLGEARTEEMRAKLQLLINALPKIQLGPVHDWRGLWRSRSWHELVMVLSRVSYHGHSMPGPEGLAVALLALASSWGRAEQAVVVAATLGGSAPLTSQLTGAMVGALHGDSWIPARWTSRLAQAQGGPNAGSSEGLEAVRELADRLAQVDCARGVN